MKEQWNYHYNIILIWKWNNWPYQKPITLHNASENDANETLLTL